jgi:hypothetical protein
VFTILHDHAAVLLEDLRFQQFLVEEPRRHLMEEVLEVLTRKV